MGLIQAFKGSVSGELANQWKELFVSDSMSADTLVKRAEHKVSGRSSNTKGDADVITKGSAIIVNEGQCALLVDSGKIIDVAAEAGAYEWEENGSASIFAGDFGDIFKEFGRRFTFGGEKPVQQRVYFVNTKDIVGLKFGTPSPIPFRILDNNVGLDVDVSVRCNGVFSYKITNPILFYQNVCGNITQAYTRSQLDGQLKTEFISALQPAFGRLSELQLRPNQIMTHLTDLENAMNAALDEKWNSLRGIEVISIALGSVTLPKEDEDLIKELQRKNVYARNAAMAGATLVEAQAEAMKNAASNANGAAMGFYGLNMAANAGGMNAQGFYQMGEQQKQQQAQAQAQQQAAGAWTCPQCGAQATGKFCPECGTKKPEADGWICPQCGTKATGKFCPECGTKRPEGEKKIKCNKCGWEPKPGEKAPKFCPECGDPINDLDEVK